jgi:hypothetical protein
MAEGYLAEQQVPLVVEPQEGIAGRKDRLAQIAVVIVGERGHQRERRDVVGGEGLGGLAIQRVVGDVLREPARRPDGR